MFSFAYPLDRPFSETQRTFLNRFSRYKRSAINIIVLQQQDSFPDIFLRSHIPHPFTYLFSKTTSLRTQIIHPFTHFLSITTSLRSQVIHPFNHFISNTYAMSIISRPQSTVDAHSTATCINHLLQCGPLSWVLTAYDIHGYEGGTCTIDVHLAGGLWALILRIARAILQAAYPGKDVRLLQPYIHPELLGEIAMSAPPIIDALGFSQNPCLISGTPGEIVEHFTALQKFGIEGLKWLLDARARCAIFSTRWAWPYAPNETFPTLPSITPSPTQTDPLALPLIELPRAINTERALILHPIHANNANAALMVHPTMSNAVRPFRDDSPYDPYSPSFNPAPTPHYSPRAAHPTPPSSTICTYDNSRAGSPDDWYSDETSDEYDYEGDVFRLDDFSAVDEYGCVVYDLTSRDAEAFMEDV